MNTPHPLVAQMGNLGYTISSGVFCAIYYILSLSVLFPPPYLLPPSLTESNPEG